MFNFLKAGTNLFLNGVVLGTLYIGGNMLSTGVLKPGDLMSFLVCAQTIQKSLGQLSILWGTYVRGMSAGARVFEVNIITISLLIFFIFSLKK